MGLNYNPPTRLEEDKMRDREQGERWKSPESEWQRINEVGEKEREQ